MKAALRRIVSEIADLIYPPRCEVCGRDSERALCSQCEAEVEWIQAPYCARCHVPLPEGQEGRALCSDCTASRSALRAVRAVGLHTGVLRDAVLRLKFGGRLRLAAALAELMWRRVKEEAEVGRGFDAAAIECLVPAELHPARRRWRGFDQSVLLAERLAALWGVPVVRCLRRVRNTPPQVELSAEERRRNIRGAFAVRCPEQIAGRTVAVVDDVMTTGATLEAAAAALRAAGAAAVYGIVVTRSAPPWHPAAGDDAAARGA